MRGPDREAAADALARLYDLDLAEDPGDLGLYRALAKRTGGPVVELAVGSGRIAVPLAGDGLEVTGVDLDAAMLRRARAHADALGPAVSGRLHLVEADLTRLAVDGGADADTARLAGRFKLAILALNSVLLLPTAADQRSALAAMSALLAPGGVAVVDAWLPDPADLVAFDGRLSLEWLRHDPATGRDVTKTVAAWLDSATRRVTLTTVFEEGAPGEPPARWTRTDALRLASAAELEHAAELAGLEVEALAGDYELGSLRPDSERVVLVAVRPGAPGSP